jgi:spermidine/putrescine transport system ATP-binding protein
VDEPETSRSLPGNARPASIETRGLTRRFGEIAALHDVSLTVPSGDFFALLGPSGCGKTTLLRILAGLDGPDEGSVFIAGRDARAVPAHQRPVNTVFQSYALFPHLNVWDNVAFGLRMKKVAPPDLSRRVADVLELVRIGELAQRKPHQISGGQKQRVALARALVNEPAVLLLDEPLAALDVKLRRDLQTELRRLQRRLGITFIHVTHDQDEALSLSDRLAVMNAGRIVQCGTPEEVYGRPRNRFVAQFIGGCNLIEASPVSSHGGHTRVRTAFGELSLPARADGSQHTLAIRPEQVLIGASAAAINRFSATIVEATFTGPETLLQLRAGDAFLKATVTNARAAGHPRVGDTVAFSLPPEALMVLED